MSDPSKTELVAVRPSYALVAPVPPSYVTGNIGRDFGHVSFAYGGGPNVVTGAVVGDKAPYAAGTVLRSGPMLFNAETECFEDPQNPGNYIQFSRLAETFAGYNAVTGSVPSDGVVGGSWLPRINLALSTLTPDAGPVPCTPQQ